MGNTPDWGAAARSQLSGLPWYLRPPPRNTMALIANEGPEKEEGENKRRFAASSEEEVLPFWLGGEPQEA